MAGRNELLDYGSAGNALLEAARDPANFDPRVADPASEQAWWRNRAFEHLDSAFDRIGRAGANTVAGVAGLSLALPSTSRAARIAGGLWGAGNFGLAGLQGYGAYDQGHRVSEALEMAERWRRGGPSEREMIEHTYVPGVPGSR